ncbi:MAG: ComEC/Rec2 family competence protein [Victivallales bacterium]|nr:ComEC/Rec2 family competence protein [Victivallales bacterium]
MPALLILLGIIFAILPQVLFPDLEWWKILLSIAPVIIIGSFLLSRKQTLILLVASFAGLLSLNIHQKITNSSYVSLLGNRDRAAEILVKVVDTSACGKDIPWLPNPGLMTVKVLKLRLNADSKWHDSYGLTAVRLPSSAPLLNYGDIISLKGSFRRSGNHFFLQKNIISSTRHKTVNQILANPGSKHFTDYLKSRNISRIFYCKEFLGIKSQDAGLYRPILAFRNFLLKNVSNGIKNKKNCALLATLLFGCKQGLDYADKVNYIKSGTIHIFTVSGLHVGILALILFWIFRWVPFRSRHLLVPAILFLYVLSTGMNPPALRAWLMIAIWCVCRAALLYIPALNIVFLTAALLLFKNPFYLNDMGFQFSFTVVGFLIISSRNSREWEQLFRELFSWIPAKNLSVITFWSEKWRRKLLLGLFGCVVAWLASSGICLYYQGIYFPFSIVANFLLIPFVLLLFNLIFLKILLSLFSFLLPFTAWLVESTTGIIDFIAGISLDLFESTHAAAPTIYGLLIFYTALLLLLLLARKRLGIIIALSILGGMIVFWHISSNFTAPSLTIIHGGGSQETAFVIIEPSAKSATVINVPSFEAARCIAARLGQSGVRKVDMLIFSANRKTFCDGTKLLAQRLKIGEVIQLVPNSRGIFLKRVVNDLLEQGTVFKTGRIFLANKALFEYHSGKIKIISKNQCLDIEYRSNLLHIKLSAFTNDNGRKSIEFVFDKEHRISCELLNSSILEMRDYSFD